MTIYDIAKEAGVSASTVSRVINGKPGIKEATRRRVQKLLDENGYIPNAAARGLVKQASRFIGILIEDIRVSHHTESAYVIEQEMTRCGYTCITFSTGADPVQKAKYIEILEQRQVEGVILIGSMFGSKQVEDTIKQHLSEIPVVLVNGTLDLPNVYSILVDEERGTAECVCALAAKGYKKLLYMMDVPTPSNQHKLEGFRTGLMKLGIPDADARVVYAPGSGISPDDTIRRGYEMAAVLLQEKYEMDVVLCATDMLAIGCMRQLQEQGIEIPEQVAVMGVDNTLYGRLTTPALSTLDNKLSELSQNAARILLEALDKRVISHKIMILPEIIERQST